MTRVEVFPSKSGKESHPVIAWTFAVALIGLCLWASHWQYQRGVTRHHRNFIVAAHVTLPPTTLASVAPNPKAAEWRIVTVLGTFDPSHQILLRNKYADGKYGFELLTLFRSSDGHTIWIDRGWIAPGATATSQPALPFTSTQKIEVTGRIRLDDSLPQGSFFAISSGGGNLIQKWNAQKATRTEDYYVDLLSTSDVSMTPQSPVARPELTDGPHMAYALQWLFFAGLVFYGRLLLKRSR